MADVKWIKITTDIFDDEKILMIESMPSADSIIVIWFKLLTFAGKQNNDGVFLMSNRIAYTDEMLASIFRRDVNTVRLALKAFEQFGMIEIIDNVITIPNWGKHQSLDAYERRKQYDRERIAKKRAAQKALVSGKSADVSGDMSADSSEDMSADVRSLDIEEDIEGDIEGEEDIKASPPASKDAVCSTDVQRIIDRWNTLGLSRVSKINPSTNRYKQLRGRIREYSVNDVLMAIENVKQSSFLKGKNKTGFIITFDWFVKPNNFPKVLEGNYTDHPTEPLRSPHQDKPHGNAAIAYMAQLQGGDHL